jgi:hypothetical protein
MWEERIRSHQQPVSEAGRKREGETVMEQLQNPVITVDVEWAVDEPAAVNDLLIKKTHAEGTVFGKAPSGHPVYRVTGRLDAVVRWLLVEYLGAPVADADTMRKVLSGARTADLSKVF